MKEVARAFAHELINQLGDQVHEVIWYGSTASGDAEDESDIEVAVICQCDDSRSIASTLPCFMPCPRCSC